MKNLLLLFLIISGFLHPGKLFAQINLVINGGFEQRDTCPWLNQQMKIVNDWSSIDTGYVSTSFPLVGDPNCSPSYVNACASYGVCSVPSNVTFYHYPHTGNGMLYHMMYSDQTDTSYYPLFLRAYAQGHLSSTLVAGQSYCVTFYVVKSNAASISVDKIGAYLDNGSIDTTGSCGLPQTEYTPQVYTTTIIGDTLNWTKIQGSFIANGTEKFITIGNFFDSAHTDKITPTPTNHFGIYLVDDVSVIPSSATAYAGPDVTITVGSSATIGATTNGDGMPCYWYILGSTTAIDSGGTIQVSPLDTITYVVSMDLCGVITYDTVTVNVLPCPGPPVASFTDTGSTSTIGFTYTGTTTSFDSVKWNFGDGGTSMLINPTYSYTAAGTYSVCVTVYTYCGINTFCHDITVTCAAPAASFTDTGSNTIGFTYTGTGLTDSLLWSFGDGDTSTLTNPIYSYTAAGTYSVCVTAYGLCSNDTFCSTVTITGCPIPVASFTDTGSTATIGFIYTGTTSGIDSVTWNFGDGATGDGLNPIHTYSASGTYSVCVTVYAPCGNDTVCNLVKVSMEAIPIISPLDNISIYPNPAGGTITIEGAQGCGVRIFNVVGEKVYGSAGLTMTNREVVNISNLVSGVYIVELVNSEGERKNVRLVKE